MRRYDRLKRAFSDELRREKEETSAMPSCPACKRHPAMIFKHSRCVTIRHVCDDFSVVMTGDNPPEQWRAMCLMMRLNGPQGQ